MYINLEGKELDVTTMTKAYLDNAIIYYEALCRDKRVHFQVQRRRKDIRDNLKAEVLRRQRLRFTCFPLDEINLITNRIYDFH